MIYTDDDSRVNRNCLNISDSVFCLFASLKKEGKREKKNAENGVSRAVKACDCATFERLPPPASLLPRNGDLQSPIRNVDITVKNGAARRKSVSLQTPLPPIALAVGRSSYCAIKNKQSPSFSYCFFFLSLSSYFSRTAGQSPPFTAALVIAFPVTPPEQQTSLSALYWIQEDCPGSGRFLFLIYSNVCEKNQNKTEIVKSFLQGEMMAREKKISRLSRNLAHGKHGARL